MWEAAELGLGVPITAPLLALAFPFQGPWSQHFMGLLLPGSQSLGFPCAEMGPMQSVASLPSLCLLWWREGVLSYSL